MTIPNVTIGKSGWLYLTRGTNHLLEQHLGIRRFSPEELDSWYYTLRARRAFCNEIGAQYATFIAPNKICVYPEFFSYSLEPAAPRPIYQLMDRCGDLINYQLNALLASKPGHQLYDEVDTHWNAWGAYVAYTDICRSIFGADVKLLSESDWSVAGRSGLGDLGNKLTPQQEGWLNWPYMLKKQIQISSDLAYENRGNMRRSHNHEGHPKKVLIFGDSFAARVFEFFAGTFREAIFCHCPYFDYAFVDAEKPDLVISHKVERFITQVPNDLMSPSCLKLHEMKDDVVGLSERHGEKFYERIQSELVDKGNIEAGLKLLAKAAEAEPFRASHPFAAMQILEQARRFNEAQIFAEKAVALKPADGSMRHALSRILRRQGKLIEARGQSEEAVRLVPANARIRENLREIEDMIAQRDQDEGRSDLGVGHVRIRKKTE